MLLSVIKISVEKSLLLLPGFIRSDKVLARLGLLKFNTKGDAYQIKNDFRIVIAREITCIEQLISIFSYYLYVKLPCYLFKNQVEGERGEIELTIFP